MQSTVQMLQKKSSENQQPKPTINKKSDKKISHEQYALNIINTVVRKADAFGKVLQFDLELVSSRFSYSLILKLMSKPQPFCMATIQEIIESSMFSLLSNVFP